MQVTSSLLFILAFVNSKQHFIEINLIHKYLTDRPICIVHNLLQDETEETLTRLLKINHTKTIVNFNGTSEFFIDAYAVNYVIISYGTQELSFLVNDLYKTGKWNTQTKHLLILTNYNSSTATNAFKLLWKYRIFNAVLVLFNNAFTWYPYDKESSCGNKIIPKRFNLSSNPFSNKLPKKLNGCPVKAIWMKYHNIITDPYSKNNSDGVVIELLRAISKIMDFVVIYPKENNPWLSGEYINRTKMTRLTHKILTEDIDIVAALFGPSAFLYIDKNLTMTSPLMFFTGYWLVPFSKPLSMWNVLFGTLHLPEYIFLLFTYVFTIFLWHFARKNHKENVSTSTWHVTKLLFQRGVKATRTKTRCLLLLTLMWLTFNVTNIYNSRLISLVTTPSFAAKPKTLKDLVELDYRFAYRKYQREYLYARNRKLAEQIEQRRINGTVVESPKMLDDFFGNLTYVSEIDSFVLSWLKNPEELQFLPEKVSYLQSYFLYCNFNVNFRL